ncbi:MAG: hypothetical protein V2A34_00245, partial [Lentisphaerota bacterium]
IHDLSGYVLKALRHRPRKSESFRTQTKPSDWIVMDCNTSEVVCKRCGERETPKYPIPVDAFTKWIEYFVARHKFCLERCGEVGK